MKKVIYNIIGSIREIYCDLIYKVFWPTKQELSNSVIVVVMASLIMALIIFLIDFSFEGIVTFFYEKIK